MDKKSYIHRTIYLLLLLNHACSLPRLTLKEMPSLMSQFPTLPSLTPGHKEENESIEDGETTPILGCSCKGAALV